MTATRPPRRRLSLSAIFAVPVVIAAASLVGLVSALAGDGWPDLVAWAGLAAPLIAIGWAWARRRS